MFVFFVFRFGFSTFEEIKGVNIASFGFLILLHDPGRKNKTLNILIDPKLVRTGDFELFGAAP